MTSQRVTEQRCVTGDVHIPAAGRMATGATRPAPPRPAATMDLTFPGCPSGARRARRAGRIFEMREG